MYRRLISALIYCILQYSPLSTEKLILQLSSVTFVVLRTSRVLKFYLDECKQLG